MKLKALLDLDKHINDLIANTKDFHTYHECDERGNLLKAIKDAIGFGMRARWTISVIDPAPPNEQLINILNVGTRLGNTINNNHKLTEAEKSEEHKKRAADMKSRMDQFLPAALVDQWARLKAELDFLQFHAAHKDDTPLFESRNREQSFFRGLINVVGGIFAGVEYDRYDPATANIPAVGDVASYTSSERQKRLAMAEQSWKGVPTKPADDFPIEEFPGEFIFAYDSLNTQRNALTNQVGLALTKPGTPAEQEARYREIVRISAKLAEIAEAFELQKEFFQSKTNDSAAGMPADVKEKRGMIVKELEYRAFVAYAASVAGKSYTEYAGYVDSEPVPPTAADTPVPPVKTRQAPQPSTRRPTQEVVAEIRKFQGEANTFTRAAKQAYNDHRIALTSLTAGKDLETAIAFADDAVEKFQEAIDVMKADGRDDLGSVKLEELIRGQKECGNLAALYRKYHESPFSKTPTEEVLSSMDSEQFEVLKPADRDFYQQLPARTASGDRTDNMFEIMIRFPKFKIEESAESIDVKAVYLHIHVKDGVTTSSFANLTDDDIAAVHLKSERHRKLGRAYTDRTNIQVQREKVSNKFAIEMAQLAVLAEQRH